MIRYVRRSAVQCCPLIAFLALALLPNKASAAWMGYRNDTDGPVIVQALGLVNNVLVRGQVHILQPGEVAWDRVLTVGNKWIVIADAKQPTRTLFQGTVQFTGSDLFFSVQTEMPPAKQSKEQKRTPQRVKLAPAKPPPMTPPK